MADLPNSTNENINATTRHLWIRTSKNQVFKKAALLTRMMLGKRISWSGGQTITRPLITDTLTSLHQAYAFNDPLTSGKKTFMDKPYWFMKFGQLPLTYNLEEFQTNISGGTEDTRILEFSKLLVQQGQDGIREAKYKEFYGMGPSAVTDYASLDTRTGNGVHVQSVRQALTHDVTYGHLSRTVATSTNTWWQGASINGDYDDNLTAYDASVYTVRRAMNAVTKHAKTAGPGEFLCCVGPSIYLSLKTEVEASKIITQQGSLVKYGFESFTIDGLEIVKDRYLDTDMVSDSGILGKSASKWLFIFHIPDWEYRIWTERNFKLTPFVWDGTRVNGYDQWLARILTGSNMICWQPNASIFLGNVS